MKRHLPYVRYASFAGLIGLLAALIIGCSTPSSPNWGQRVGHYTYEQALTDLGTPQQNVLLADGSRIVKWVKSRGVGTSLESSSETVSRPSEMGIPSSVGNTVPDKELQLRFGPDGKLVDWNRNY